MLVPKPPRAPGFCPEIEPAWFNQLTAELGLSDRRALREICERREIVEMNDQTFLLASVSEPTIDTLAAFEAEARAWRSNQTVRTHATGRMIDQTMNRAWDSQDHTAMATAAPMIANRIWQRK